ncbi:FAD-dependent oxidoreductase [Massilia putida]|uniref:FAD-dependent oxidoreductase n=1 Tax=Massilia putida TaxID=1141883 RepID=UPI000951212F|nr:FAD-dependent oxidoreductase [Massilia putida]
MKTNRIAILLLIAAAVAAYFIFDLGRYANLGFLKSSQDALRASYDAHPMQSIAAFAALYILATALSVPGAALMTLAGGAIFGLGLGALIVSFAASIGATLAFLASRHLLRDWVRARFGRKLDTIDHGVERDGPFYLFTLRLVPLFPFFAINLLMGLTPLRTWTYYWVSQLGMLPGTLLYVNAGTQLARVRSVHDILSPTLLGSLVLIGLLPLMANKVLQASKARKIYRKWTRPRSFDRNLVVIGAGAAGLVTAYIAAAVKARVTLVESGKMGGDCLNYGCVPSKALIRSARFVHQARQAPSLGIASADLEVDFADIMARVQRVIRTIAPHDSVERYQQLGVDVMRGHARIVSPWEVEIDGKVLTTRAIVIATGARPIVPPIPGLDDVGYLTSDTLWTLTTLPKRLVVLGGGPIGCELAQAFARLGSQVTQVEKSARLLAREDPEVSALVERALTADGVTVLTGYQAVRCQREPDGGKTLLVERADSEGKGETATAIGFDVLLCAVGRVARTEGFGLEELGIPTTQKKTIETDAWLQTLFPNIYACGDVAGPYQFTHTAAHQAWYAAVNALFGGIKRFKSDYSVIPWCTFTDPEVARVGLSETEAREQQVEYEVTRFDLAELDRAVAEEAPRGFVKVLTVPGKDKILGATIVGEHAGDLMAEYVLAMKHGIGLNKILGTIHIYPTLAEANNYAAGEWKRAHAPQRLLAWAARFHAWRRRANMSLENP